MRDLSDHIRTTTAAISADPTKSYQPSVQMQKSVAVRYSYYECRRCRRQA